MKLLTNHQFSAFTSYCIINFKASIDSVLSNYAVSSAKQLISLWSDHYTNYYTRNNGPERTDWSFWNNSLLAQKSTQSSPMGPATEIKGNPPYWHTPHHSPASCSLTNSVAWLTVSNAFIKSMNKPSHRLPSLIPLYTCPIKYKSAQLVKNFISV